MTTVFSQPDCIFSACPTPDRCRATCDSPRAGVDPHKDLVRFLREVDDRPDGVPEAVQYEPIVRTRPERISIGAGSRIDSFVKLEGGLGLTIGRFVHIASFAHLGIGGGTLLIDDFAAVASGGRVISGSNQLDAPSMSAAAPMHLQRVKASVTRLGRYSCVLTNAVVMPGVTLGEGAILAAGGVATKDIPAWEVWGGVPARFMSKRPQPEMPVPPAGLSCFVDFAQAVTREGFNAHTLTLEYGRFLTEEEWRAEVAHARKSPLARHLHARAVNASDEAGLG